MKVYKVEFTRINWGAYFGGSNYYWMTAERYFTTKEKAEAFVAEPIKEYVKTWDKEVEVKKAGEGKVEEIEVE